MDSNCGDFPNGLLSWKLIQFELDKFGHPLDCRIRIRWIISASFMNKLIFFDTFEGVRGGVGWLVGWLVAVPFVLEKPLKLDLLGPRWIHLGFGMDPFWDYLHWSINLTICFESANSGTSGLPFGDSFWDSLGILWNHPSIHLIWDEKNGEILFHCCRNPHCRRPDTLHFLLP